MLRYFFLLVLTFHLSTCYVLKLKNEGNRTDAGAPEHKVPPIDAQIFNGETAKRFEVKNRANDDDVNEKKQLASRKSEKHTVYMINQAFEALKNTFGKPEFRSSKTMSFIDKILDALKDFVNGPEFRSSKTMRYIEKIIDIVKEAASGPEYRSGGQANLKTEMVHFRRGQPSLVFEVKPNFFVDVVKKVLSANLVERYMDDLAHGQRKPKKYIRYP